MSAPSSTSLKSYLLRNQIYFNATVIGVSVLLIMVVATRSFKHYSEQNLSLIAQSLANQLDITLVFDDKRTAQDTITRYQKQYHLRHIEVSDLQQQTFVEAYSPRTDAMEYLEYIQGLILSKSAGTATIAHNGVALGQVQIVETARPLLDFIQLISGVLLSCLVFTLLCIYLNIRLIYQKITYSLEQLAQTSTALTQQRDFNQRVPMGEIREFNAISTSFNQLLEQLQQWELQLEQENQSLTHRALHDPLTQLPNRDYFDKHLNYLLGHARARHDNSFALLYLDNDKFKQVNDQYGHNVGDQLLCAMVERIQATVVHEHFMARIGGDEFAIILYHCTSIEQVLPTVHALLYCQDTPLCLPNQLNLDFNFSIGIALSYQAQTVQELIHQADQAMYQAKHHQHYKFAFYSSRSLEPHQ